MHTREVIVEPPAPESREPRPELELTPELELAPELASFGSPPDGVLAELHAAKVSRANQTSFFMASSPRGTPASDILRWSRTPASMVCRWDGQGKHLICVSDILGLTRLGHALPAWPHV